MIIEEEAEDSDRNDEDKAEGEASGGDSPEEGAEGEEGGGEGKKSKKKLILLIAVPLVLLIGAGAGLYFTGMLDSLLGKSSDSEHAEDSGEGHGGGHGEGGGGGHGGAGVAFLEIPTITVNLQADDGTPRYLRLSVQLELASEEDKAAVEAVMPRVIDQFQTYLRELRVRDLRGSAGIYRLQMELLWRVNQAAAPTEVKDVLFQEILIN